MRCNIALALGVLVFTLAAEVRAESDGNATIPLKELLELHKATTAKVAPPPRTATLERMVFESRLLRGAVTSKATIHLSVLTDAWVEVPLFERNPGLTVLEVSHVENGHVVVGDGQVSFVSNVAGDYAFEVVMTQKATVKGGLWRAGFQIFPTTVSRMELQHDNTTFDVPHDASQVDGGTVTLLPTGGTYEVSWKEKTSETEVVAIASRPKIQPIIESAYADIVSTLDGQRISRYRYDLKLQGNQSLSLSVPQIQRVTKVFLNGVSIPFEIDEGKIDATVAPPRVGGESATIELVTQTDALPYSLSGHLRIELPSASWDLNQQYVTLHLPDVFNYTRRGGSLGLTGSPQTTDFAHSIPTPGKTLSAKQQLVTSSPNLELQYTVDLDGKYYRGRQ